MNMNKRLKDTFSIVKDIHQEHPEWNATEIRNRYLAIIGDTSKAVTISAIQKHLATIKEKEDTEEYKALEYPWQLSNLVNPEYQKYYQQYHISSEAISRIMNVWKWTIGQMKQIHPLTMREAIWISRLYHVLENNKKWQKQPLEESLWKVANVYASFEKSEILSGKRFSTIELDYAVMQGVTEFTEFIKKPMIFLNYVEYLKDVKGKKDGEK